MPPGSRDSAPQRGQEQLVLAAIGVIQALAVHPEPVDQVLDAGGAIAPVPEYFHRFVERGALVELLSAYHTGD